TEVSLAVVVLWVFSYVAAEPSWTTAVRVFVLVVPSAGEYPATVNRQVAEPPTSIESARAGLQLNGMTVAPTLSTSESKVTATSPHETPSFFRPRCHTGPTWPAWPPASLVRAGDSWLYGFSSESVA